MENPLKGSVIYEDSTMASSLSLTGSGDNYQAGRDVKSVSGSGEGKAVCEQVQIRSRKEGLILDKGWPTGSGDKGDGDLATWLDTRPLQTLFFRA